MKQSQRQTKSKGKSGAPKGNRNAAKLGRDLKYQSYMSKLERSFFEEFFQLRFGRAARDDKELTQLARQLATQAIRREMVAEFERHEPGRTTRGSSEVF